MSCYVFPSYELPFCIIIRCHEQDSLVELGTASLCLREFDDALGFFYDAFMIRKHQVKMIRSQKNRDKVKLHIARILNNIGCVHFDCGAFREALETYDESLEIQRNVFSSWDDEYSSTNQGILVAATTLCNISQVHMHNGKWEDAITALREAVEVSELVNWNSIFPPYIS